jgi:molybdopterin converting factor small subunit
MAKVKLFGALRDRAEIGMVEAPGGMTIRGILEHLGKTYGSPVRDLLLEEKDGRMVKRQAVVILIEGRSQIDLERPVGLEETVTIFPAVAGG